MTPIKQKTYDHIPLADLVDGALYIGHCRNATSATWHADRQLFTYVREKFGNQFIEDIRPPGLDDVYDVFYAVERKNDGTGVYAPGLEGLSAMDVSTMPEVFVSELADDTDPEGRKAFRAAIRASVGKEGK